jgi:urea transport system substrate-binding protein
LLKRAGQTSLTLAAAQALSPFLLSGCGSSGTNARGGGGGGDTIKVGIMHSLSGFMKISESSLKDAEMMAIDEINAAGGVLGKKIEPIVEDPASDMEKGFPEKAKKLLQSDNVACVFGCWTSASRKSVLSIFEKSNGLLFYPVQYEGNECSKNVIYTGAAPNQQILPAVDYIVETLKKKRWYLLGSDYVFPQTANQIIIAQLKSKYKLDPVNDEDSRTKQRAKYVSLTHKDFKTVVDDIKAKGPDVIFSTINGDSNLPFYNELAANKITAGSIPVCAVSVGEDELRGLEPPIVEGHLAAWNYFQTVNTPENKEFVKKFQDKYGKDRVTDDPIEAAYYQVYLWKQAVEKAKTTDVDKVIEAVRGQTFKAPGGMVKVDEKNNHTWKTFRLGKIRGDRQFDTIFESKEWIRPEPYPQVAYPGMDCDWTKGGIVKPAGT